MKNREEIKFTQTQAELLNKRETSFLRAERPHITSGGFTTVAAFEAEYSRRGPNEVMEKAITFYKGSSNCVKPLLAAVTYLRNMTE